MYVPCFFSATKDPFTQRLDSLILPEGMPILIFNSQFERAFTGQDTASLFEEYCILRLTLLYLDPPDCFARPCGAPL